MRSRFNPLEFGRRMPSSRRALTTIETLVALSLLVAGMSLAATAVARNHRLLADSRDYRVAVEALTDELDRLSRLGGDELRDAVDGLVTPEFVAATPAGRGAMLSGRLDAMDGGLRITLVMSWPDSNRSMPPVRLVGWSFVRVTQTPADSAASNEALESLSDGEANDEAK